MSVIIGVTIELPNVQNVELDDATIITLSASVDTLRIVTAYALSSLIGGIRNGSPRRTLLVLNASTDFELKENYSDADPKDRIANGGIVTAGCGALLWYDPDHLIWRVLARS
jgi:hypothetical protein